MFDILAENIYNALCCLPGVCYDVKGCSLARARVCVISFACEVFLVEGNQKATLLNVLYCYCTGFVVHLGNKVVST